MNMERLHFEGLFNIPCDFLLFDVDVPFKNKKGKKVTLYFLGGLRMSPLHNSLHKAPDVFTRKQHAFN